MSIKQERPKLLVMGSKSYEFECGDSNLYSPRTCINESGTSPEQSFPSSMHSPFAQSLSPKPTSHHSSENFLCVPNGLGYRKLSCPNIDFELTHSSNENFKLDDYMTRVKSQSGSSEQLGHYRYPYLSSEFTSSLDHQTQSFDRLAGLHQSTLSYTIADIDRSNSSTNLSNFIEMSLITSIQSLKLSLDFYRYFMSIKSDSTDSGMGTIGNIATEQQQQQSDQTTNLLVIPTISKPESFENNKQQQFILQNLYLDVLEVETMLYDFLSRFKNSPNWPIFVAKYIHQLQKAIDKVSTYLFIYFCCLFVLYECLFTYVFFCFFVSIDDYFCICMFMLLFYASVCIIMTQVIII